MISADTNVFVYLYQADAEAKRATARTVFNALIAQRAPVGIQVVGELQNVIRRKFKRSALEAADAGRSILANFATFPSSSSAADHALSELASSRMSYWDALLVFSAAEAGVQVLISEDMKDGAVIAGVTIVNPFGRNGALSESARLVLNI